MKKKLYIEIENKIAEYINEKRLSAGDKLPSYRDFAELYNVSSNTVGNALERLQLRGIIEIRPQSGIFVAEEAWTALYPNSFNWQSYFQKSKQLPVDMLKRFSGLRMRYGHSDARYLLSYQGVSTELDWHNIWEKSIQKAIKYLDQNRLFMPVVNGDEMSRLCVGLSNHMKTYGLDVTADSIQLTKNSKGTLLSIALSFFSPGTVCYYQAPSMLDTSGFFDLTGHRKVPLPCDSEGLDLGYFSGLVKAGERAYLVVWPDLSNAGLSMSMNRRKELYNFCYANSIPIIEMDEYRILHSAAQPPIKSLDRHGIVFYVGSFGNMHGGFTEASWIAATAPLIERLQHIELSMWQIADILPHLVAYEMFASGDYYEYQTNLRCIMHERKQHLNNLLTKYLGDIAKWNEDFEVFTWVKLRNSIDAIALANNDEGLVFRESSLYNFVRPNSVHISLTGIHDDDMEDAIKLLSVLARQ